MRRKFNSEEERIAFLESQPTHYVEDGSPVKKDKNGIVMPYAFANKIGQWKTRPESRKGGYTKEKREAKAKEKEAAMERKRLASVERRISEREQILKKCAEKGWNPSVYNGENAEKLNQVIDLFTNQLAIETIDTPLVDYDLKDAKSVAARRAQMAIIKDHISMIDSLKKLRDQMVEDNTTSNNKDILSYGNVSLLEDARKLMMQKK